MRAAANIRIWFPTEECGAKKIRTVFCGDNIFQCCCALALNTTLLIFPSFSWLSVAYPWLWSWRLPSCVSEPGDPRPLLGWELWLNLFSYCGGRIFRCFLCLQLSGPSKLIPSCLVRDCCTFFHEIWEEEVFVFLHLLCLKSENLYLFPFDYYVKWKERLAVSAVSAKETIVFHLL